MKVPSAGRKAQTINCLLCRDLVAYTKESRERFDSHMAIEHGISENMNYILAGCLMKQEERDVVAKIIEEREETSLGATNGTEVKEKLDEEAVKELDDEVAGVEKKEAKLEVVKSMACGQCGEEFIDRRSLWLHRKSHHKHVQKEEPKRKRASGVEKEEEPLKKKAMKEEEQVHEAGDKEVEETLLSEVVTKELEKSGESTSKGSKRKLKRASKEIKDLDKEKEEQNSDTECDECQEEFKDQKGLRYHKFREHGSMPLEEEDYIRKVFPSPSGKKGKKSPKSEKSPKVKDMAEAAKSDEGPDVDAKQVERQRILKESEYFGSHPNEITIYTSKEEQSIKDDEFLPPDWTAVERVTISGRKIISLVNPEKVLSFRSRVGVFEFLKFSGRYSEAELETYQKKYKTRKSI